VCEPAHVYGKQAFRMPHLCQQCPGGFGRRASSCNGSSGSSPAGRQQLLQHTLGCIFSAAAAAVRAGSLLGVRHTTSSSLGAGCC
jgi:hypothetical protein